VVAVGGGMVASLVAVLSPLRDILSRDPLAATAPKQDAGAGGVRLWPVLAALACLAVATVILLAAPQAAIFGMVALVGALLLVLPLVLALALALTGRLARVLTSAVPHVAVMELRASRVRALAVAATGAVAVFGGVAIEGAHGDLLKGLEDAARDMNASTDVWVSPAGSYNLLETAPFAPTQEGTLARLPGVRAVRVYRGGLLDIGERRVWVIAPPSAAVPLLPASQIVEGNVRRATARVRGGGWVVLSRALAEELRLRIGDALVLPSPVPIRFRVAALSTNIGWPPGAIVMSAGDYARAWGSDGASAYNILLEPSASLRTVMQEVRRALGVGSGLAVQSAGQHAGRERALSRAGLVRLSQIAVLILVGAVLAMAAAIGTMVWQRRPRLAKLRLEGFSRGELWRMVLLESVLLLGVGCGAGAVFGLYGQQLLDRALANVINFPVVSSVAVPAAVVCFAVVLAAAAVALAAPGWLAVRVQAALALED
jgi:putative ABC transport system permease protein